MNTAANYNLSLSVRNPPAFCCVGLGILILGCTSRIALSDENPCLSDINGDGRLDYCRIENIHGTNYIAITFGTQKDLPPKLSITPPKLSITPPKPGFLLPGFKLEMGSFALVNPPSGETIYSKPMDPGEPTSRAWIDVNEDGAVDFCRVIHSNDGHYWLCCLLLDPRRKSFIGETEPHYLPYSNLNFMPELRTWIDLNGDGVPDFTVVIDSGSERFVEATMSRGSPSPFLYGDPFKQNPVRVPITDKKKLSEFLDSEYQAVIKLRGLDPSAPRFIGLRAIALPEMGPWIDIVQKVLSIPGDQEIPGSREDRGWETPKQLYKDFNDWKFQKDMDHTHETFRGDAPADRIEKAGRQS